MPSDVAIRAESMSHCYPVYSRPRDRLLQMLPLGKRCRYREFWALKSISFEISEGEAIGVIGRRGSGKSTLLKLVYGTLSPTSGTLRVQGRVAVLLELGAGFNAECSGRENIYMAAALYGLSLEEINLRFSAIAAFADIGGLMEQPLMTYTRDMCIRLAFAVAAHVDADILLIDEALFMGDAGFRQKCMRFMHKFKEEHALIFVSHDMDAVINLCDRVIWLEGGEERQTGPAKVVCESYLGDVSGSMETDLEHLSVVRGDGRDRPEWRDQRACALKSSELEVFRFDPQAPGAQAFGGEEARIVDVRLNDAAGVGLTWMLSGERITLEVVAQTSIFLERPLIGFFVKDHLGQTLFGDNTHINQVGRDRAAPAGSKLRARFEFSMPSLAKGDYVIQVAIADGEQHDHKQLHWCHEALLIRSNHDPVSSTINGIPFINKSLDVTNP
ncbi:ABC transporter ATP-binding protein [Pseudomonas gingeri]|nr:ABC transporter ATP-binding protein [Pseudomonas gingeri]NWA03508.1 ABC transporter ATP-binding protein [Pseudomonas gingeri]NWA14366.1 ABC transporter ATP-binding protein [Pseudomonas gingeri]NWA55016.1 ABC transporter ATP-binding protein [Pseudomonas gingeri]NWA94740.1 ABC transporter ATP-binding protein [Pseudomonas gingeri]NWB01396.1 ABC transporter ATP-binding protein [Pseudomonas gingeri]